jgi:hypothetical protein
MAFSVDLEDVHRNGEATPLKSSIMELEGGRYLSSISLVGDGI